jgi:NAD(P)-dependent dehydrogenase (short-subunit alcohol dehydrogenase family)
MGAQGTIVSRNAKKCATLTEAIEVDTGSVVEFIAADLSTLAGSMQATVTFKQRHTYLHVLVKNAGAMFARLLTSDGYEITLVLNRLNYFLLAVLLMDILRASAPARIVNVSSHAHEGAVEDFDNLQGE